MSVHKASQSKRIAKIVVIGSANMDLVARVPRLPQPGETILGTNFEMLPGGKGANQAVAAARLGAVTHFIGRIGVDVFGKSLEDSLKSAGVQTEFLIHDGTAPTGAALIGVNEASGENSIIVVPGANANVIVDDLRAAIDVIQQADIVMLSLEIPLSVVEAALEIAAKAGVKTILNPAPAMALSSPVINSCSVLTPNEHEVGILAGDINLGPKEAARKLIDKGAKTVVVTLGAEGAYGITADGTEIISPAVHVDKVVDTTAAGDCYSAALAVALAEGAVLTNAMQFAAVSASISVTRPGAQSSMPSRAEVDAVMRSNVTDSE